MARWPYGSSAWTRARRDVLARAGGRCEIRGPGCLGDADQVDHIIPLIEILDEHQHRHTPAALQAATDPSNLRAACRRCNSVRGARLGARRRWTGNRRRTRTIPRVSRDW